MMEKKAVLLSAPRTGSTMITRQLHAHPQAYFIGAIFSRKGWDGAGPGYAPLKQGLGPEWDDLEYRIAHRRKLMNRMFGLDVAPCMGFKHHWSNDRTVNKTILADDSIAKIVLTRPNFLAAFSSDQLVEARKALPRDAASPKTVAFDPEQFAKYIKRRKRIFENWAPLLAKHADRCLPVTYTEARTDDGMARILDFLGLEQVVLEKTTVKRNSDRVVDRFTEPEKVLDYLKAEGLEHWAEEQPGVAA